MFVHGSWGDHHNWDLVVPKLARDFQVLTYDRRGHSESERTAAQGSVFEDADDLAALVEHLGLAPAHVVGNSYGSAITLRAATRHPGLTRRIVVHEPPLLPLLAGTEFEPMLPQMMERVAAVAALLEAGDNGAGARQFAETIAFGPGAWENDFTPESRATFVANAPTWLDETKDPDGLMMDLDALAQFDRPALVTSGSASAPFFGPIADIVANAIPGSERVVMQGADHAPQYGVPDRYVEMVGTFVSGSG